MRQELTAVRVAQLRDIDSIERVTAEKFAIAAERLAAANVQHEAASEELAKLKKRQVKSPCCCRDPGFRVM